MFGLIVLEAKTEIARIPARGMPESTAIFSVEAARQMYNQTNEFVYLGGNVSPNAGLYIEVNRRIRNAWCSFRKNTLELYDRPSALLELKNPDTQSRGTQDNAVRLCHVEPARAPQRHAAPSPPQLSDLLHRLAQEQSRRPPDFLSGNAYQDRTYEHRGDFMKEAELVRGTCGAYGGYETVDVRDVRRIGRGYGLCGRGM